MEREIKTTSDGSKTLYVSTLDECYHSHHGALQEAEHVFIKFGYNLLDNYEINILELGFGTGLNVLVTINSFLQNGKKRKVHYHTLEKYPVSLQEIESLNYPSLFSGSDLSEINQKIHSAPWEEETEIVPGFFLTKYQRDFYELDSIAMPPIDLVYFDCFGARVQPDLWEAPLFTLVHKKMRSGGLLTTYSSKGSVRRLLQELAMEVEKREGPPGKREMITAVKPSE